MKPATEADMARALVRRPDVEALDPLLAGGQSPHTLAARRQDAACFVDWLEECDLDVDELDELALIRYRDDLGARYAPATVNRRLSTVRLLLRRLYARGSLARPPAFVGGLRDRDYSRTPALTRDQVVRLYAAARADDSPRGRRDHALLRLGVRTGLRKAEILAARWAAFELERDHRVYVYTAKGGTERRTKVAPELWAELDAWRAELESIGGGADCWPALTGAGAAWTPGPQLSRSGLDGVVARRARQAGLGELGVTPHSLRATHITLGLEAGCDVHRMARSVGHSSTATTLRYDAQRDALDHHATDYLAGL